MKTARTRTRGTRRLVPPAVLAGGFPAELRARAALLRDGTAAGSFLADEVSRLADLAEFFGAGSPTELVDRRDVAEEDLRSHWYELGQRHALEPAD